MEKLEAMSVMSVWVDEGMFPGFEGRTGIGSAAKVWSGWEAEMGAAWELVGC